MYLLISSNRLKATLFDGSFHEADSSEMAFKIENHAFEDGAKKANPVILEPIMRVENNSTRRIC